MTESPLLAKHAPSRLGRQGHLHFVVSFGIFYGNPNTVNTGRGNLESPGLLEYEIWMHVHRALRRLLGLSFMASMKLHEY
jgi:hypothetical protein